MPNEGDGAVRAAARLNSAGCRAFRSSVEARHRGFAAGHRPSGALVSGIYKS